MAALSSFDYAVIRIVPRVEREEFVNAGVVLQCLERSFLGMRMQFDEERLRSLWPQVELEPIRSHLAGFASICDGKAEASPIAQLSKRERFGWLVAPRSTVIQISPVHSGLCEMPEEKLDRLFEQLVATKRGADGGKRGRRSADEGARTKGTA